MVGNRGVITWHHPWQGEDELQRHGQRQHEELVEGGIQEIEVHHVLIGLLSATFEEEALHIPPATNDLGMTVKRVGRIMVSYK